MTESNGHAPDPRADQVPAAVVMGIAPGDTVENKCVHCGEVVLVRVEAVEKMARDHPPPATLVCAHAGCHLEYVKKWVESRYGNVT